MQVQVYDQNKKPTEKLNVPDTVFGVPMNRDLLYQVTSSQYSNQRQITAHVKDRSEVRGGGKKPWRQKGTGRARHGSIRSPIWRGGGVTHGPSKERNFKKKINRKVAHNALAVALSDKIREKELIVVDKISIDELKTKRMLEVLKNISELLPGYVFSENKKSSVLLVVPTAKEGSSLLRTVSNLSYVDISPASDINAFEILSFRYVVLFKDSIEKITKILRGK